MLLWRMSNHADLSGEGGRRVAGRWHERGRPVVYLSEREPAAGENGTAYEILYLAKPLLATLPAADAAQARTKDYAAA